MANFNKYFSAVAIATMLTLSFFGLSSCSTSTSADSAEEFAPWIDGFTGGYVKADSPIKVVFTNPVKPGIQANSLLSFQPAVKGSAKWSDDRKELTFTPEKGALVQGRNYNAAVKMASIMGEDRQFRFSFKVAPKHLALESQGVVVSPDNREMARIHVNAVLSEDAAIAPEMITAQEGKVSVDGTSIIVSEIARGHEDRVVKVKADLSSLGFREKPEVEVTIPALDEFKIVRTRMIAGGTPAVEVRFSEPLDKERDLAGLVSLKGTNGYACDVKDNVLKLYYEPKGGNDITLDISGDLKSADGTRLGKTYAETFTTGCMEPKAKFISKGNILSNPKDLKLILSTRNLRAFEVRVIRIYENNILSFLQNGGISNGDGLKKNGRLVFSKTIAMDQRLDLTQWQNTALDLSGIIREEQGAIYRVRIVFNKDCYLYSTSEFDIDAITNSLGKPSEEEMAVWDSACGYDWGIEDSDWTDYNWMERNDPSKDTYYMYNAQFPSMNVIASNLGIIAKGVGNGKLWVAVSDINDASPVFGAKICAYNFQKQLIAETISDVNGLAVLNVEGNVPFIVTAEKHGLTSYLRVPDGEENPTTKFDTFGTTLQKGTKGFIFGERGVWRPGDTVHLFLVVEDKENRIPDTHPVRMDLYTPLGQSYATLVNSEGRDGFYRFDIATDQDAPTGIWSAIFTVGGSTFTKNVRIETVKPNRLKVNMKLGNGLLKAGVATDLDIESNWLTGPAAAGLKTRTEITLGSMSCGFSGYKGYVFDSPVSTFTGSETVLSERALDADGHLSTKVTIPQAQDAGGMLRASITCRVFEKGGDASIYSESRKLSPYERYVGIRLSDNYETDADLEFPVVSVDPDGKPCADAQLVYRIWKIDWSWWWESGYGNLSSYVNGTASAPLSEGTLVTDADGAAAIRFRQDYPEYGTYFVYVKDTRSGHATGGTMYIDWPSWRGHSKNSDPSALTMLTFSLDKKEYRIGETATVYIPAAASGRALVSVENSHGVISRAWVGTSASGSTKYCFTVTREMTPNAYVDITLVRPNNGTMNGQPLRLYGVQPLMVVDEDSRLRPEIEMPDAIEPQQQFTVKVKEAEGKPMTYVLAIVDDGLLDLTNFKTPDIWGEMNAREALAVKTWDFYDDVIGAYSGLFSRITSIGGDAALNSVRQKNNRFNPVVEVLGPFATDGKGDSQTITLPMYVGSVRVMVVAGKDGAYGKAEKTVPVRSPLMILPTLPRQLKVGEKLDMPVNVFALDESVKDVKVSVSIEGPLKLTGTASQSISFEKTGDKMVSFALETASRQTGSAKVTITATSGKNKASSTIEIKVAQASDPITYIDYKLVQKGGSADFSWEPFKADSQNSISLTKASFPTINTDGISEYMENYAYNCSEQLSSKLMTFLYLKKGTERIPAVIKELLKRQLPSGGFAYWPENSWENWWVSSMAGQALMEAKAQGYEVPDKSLQKWLKFQKNTAKQYMRSQHYDLSDLDQAYRLYTLALAGSPDVASMNRLREQDAVSNQAWWRLAAAYAVAGKGATAKQMLAGRSTDFSDCGRNATFWSRQRDMAMMLETLLIVGDADQAALMAIKAAESFNRVSWHSTQDIAFMASAMGRFTPDGGRTENVEVDASKGGVTVTNDFDGQAFVSLCRRVVPSINDKVEAEWHGLEMTVGYFDMDGNALDPTCVKQGEDIEIVINVHNASGFEVENIALACPFPSGWEAVQQTGNAGEDIRDERAIWHFDLAAGETVERKVRCQVSYAGTFLLAPVKCEAMYDNAYRCNSESGIVTVTR